MNLAGKLSQEKIVRFSRLICLAACIYDLMTGNWIIGIYILLALVAMTAPAIATRNYLTYLPMEFELLFLLMVILQFVIGETLKFYDLVPYYDKFVHFLLPCFLGIMGFLIAYSMHKSGNLRITTSNLMVVIVLMTLGIGALWEIIEYLYDIFIAVKHPGWKILQGNLVESPLVDTMNDLIADLLGGFFGAVMGRRYIKAEQKKDAGHLARLAEEIASNFRGKKHRWF